MLIMLQRCQTAQVQSLSTTRSYQFHHLSHRNYRSIRRQYKLILPCLWGHLFPHFRKALPPFSSLLQAVRQCKLCFLLPSRWAGSCLLRKTLMEILKNAFKQHCSWQRPCFSRYINNQNLVASNRTKVISNVGAQGSYGVILQNSPKLPLGSLFTSTSFLLYQLRAVSCCLNPSFYPSLK